MPTSKQLAMIHIEAARAGLIEKGNRIPFNNLLRNVGGVGSSKDLSQAAFEDCMAVIEDTIDGKGLRAGRYWRDKVALRGGVANPRMTAKIHALAKESRYQIGALCLRFSDDRTWAPEKLYPREAWQLIEMLKASNAREAGAGRRGQGDGEDRGRAVLI